MPTHGIDGLDIHFVQGGPTDAAKRLLYVHGTGCNAGVWARHCERLPADCQYVSVDLAGHGESGGTGFRGTADHAFVIDGLVEHLASTNSPIRSTGSSWTTWTGCMARSET